MHILLIITPFSPAQTPNTLRWRPLVDYMISKGHRVSVLTTRRKGYAEEEEEDGLKIHRAGYHTMMDKLYDLLGSDKRRHETGGGMPQVGLLSGMVQKIVDKTWRKSYWPDGSKLFLKPGIKRGKEIVAKEDITHIISVGIPFTCHWIARALKASASGVQWHMDIQDPFCYSKEFWVNNFSRYKEKNVKAEAEAFLLADTISVTNPRAGELYKDLFREQAHKLKVIPPLYTPPADDSKYDMILYSRKIHLGYFGSFYEGVRSPMMFFRFLKFLHEQDASLFDQIQFHFVGQIDRVSLPMFDVFPEIRRYMVIHGFMTRSETLDAMSQVDILMNVGNTTDYHLPSKVVDYLAAGKPIVNFTSVGNDSTSLFFGDKETEVLDLLLAEKHFAEQAERFLEFVNRERGEQVVRPGDLEPYVLKSVASAYMDAMGQKKN